MVLKTLPHSHWLLLAISVVSLSAASVFAQKQPPLFEITDLPVKANYNKAKLNAEVSSLPDLAAVKNVLKSKSFPPETMVIVKISRPGSKPVRWSIMLGGPLEKKGNSIILQSKGNATSQFYKLSDFKNLFKDTLAVIDTLSVDLFIHDEDYPKDQYELSFKCNGNTAKKAIPLVKGKLIFTNQLVDSCGQQPVPVTLTNGHVPDRLLSSCNVVFLLPDQQEILTDVAEYYRKQYPDKPGKEITQLVWNWAALHFGKLLFTQLITLLNKKQS